MLTCDRDKLLAACRLAAAAASIDKLRPLLRGCRLAAGPGGLTLTATDLQVWVTAAVPADAPPEPWSAVVMSPQKLRQVLAAHPKETEVQLGLARRPPPKPRPADPPGPERPPEPVADLKVRLGDASYELAALDAAGWPKPAPAPPDTPPAEFPAGRLRKALGRAAAGSGRPAEAGAERFDVRTVQFAFGGDGLTLAGTDGLRLFVSPLGGPAAAEQTALLPKPAAGLLESALGGLPADEVVWVSAGKSAFFAAAGDFTFAAQLAVGRPVPWRHLVPEGEPPVVFDRDRLHRAVKLALVTAPGGDGGHAVRLRLSRGDDGLRAVLSARSHERGSGDVECPAAGEAAVEADVWLGAKDLAAFLALAGGEAVRVGFRRPYVVVRAEGGFVGVFHERVAPQGAACDRPHGLNPSRKAAGL